MAQVFLTAGTTTWTVPDDFDVNSASVEVIGPGGKGSARQSSTIGGVGGGGGGYAKATTALASLGLTRGSTVTVQVGSGSTQTATWFSSSGFLQATSGANATTTTAGAGGVGSGTGASLTHTGGSGFRVTSGSTGGGGGGAAGPHGNGASATSTTGGAADAGNTTGGAVNTVGTNGTQFDATHGCGSGAGGSSSGVGKVGGSYGGGNSGNSTVTTTPPASANGLIVITYTSDPIANAYYGLGAWTGQAVTPGNRCSYQGNAYECITGGASPAPPTGTGTDIQPASTGTTWHVATTGNDTTGNGSAGAPYATITKASTVAQPGDTVLVAAGDYLGGITTTASGSFGKPITYKSATQWGARLTVPASNSNVFAWTNGGTGSDGTVAQYVIIDGFHVDGSTFTTGSQWRFGIYCTGNNNLVQNCKVHDFTVSSGNGGSGIEIDGWYGGGNGAILTNFVYNILPGTGSTTSLVHGIYIACNGCLCAGNLVVNDDITSWHGTNALQIINNTCINGIGILVGSGDISDANTSGAHYYTGACGNCNVFNNIVYASTQYGIEEEADTATGGAIGTNNKYANNILYNCTNGATLMVNGVVTDTITTQPSFVNNTGNETGDYHLNAGSVGVAGGVTTLAGQMAYGLDQDGHLRTGTYDIGCYQRGSSAPTDTAHWKFLSRVDFSSIQAAHDAWTAAAAIVIQCWRSDKNRSTADIQLTSASNSAFSLSGKATSATVTVTVQPAPGEGFADALRADNTKPLAFNAANGFAILCPSDAASFANFIYIGENYVTLKGLQIQDPLTTSGSTIIFGPNSNITVDSCLVDGTAQSGGANTVVLSGGAGAFINSLFIDHQGATDGISACQLAGTGGGKAINCTWYNPNNTTGNAVIGNTIGETYTVRNCITVGFQQSIIDNSAAVNIDHCQTDQTSFSTISTGESVGAGCSYSVSGSSQFVTPGSNFRLKSTSPAIGAGATDTTDIPTSLDIMGQIRTVPWDIGAAEYIVTAVSYALSGAAATAAVGFVSKTAAEQLVSASTTSAAGALIKQAQETLVGTAAISTAGTASKTAAEQFTGTAATASAGLAGTALVQQTAITGATAASASGIVNKTAAEQFVGASSSAITGSAAFIAGEQLLGAGVVVSVSAINKQASDQAAASSTAQVGSVSFAPQIALAGAAATTFAGLVTAFLQRALTGASATSFAGSPLLGRGAAVTGVEADSAAGTVGLEADEIALSAQVQAQSGEYGLTRASTATYIGPDVIMHDADVNELRYTYDSNGNITGPLLESASNNLLTNSNTFNWGWNSVVSSDIAKLYAPADLRKITCPTSGTGYNGAAQINIAIDPSALYVISAWVYIPSSYTSTGPVRVDFDNPNLTIYAQQVSDLSLRDQWQRIWTSVRSSVTASTFNFVIRQGAPFNAGDSFYFQSCQAEPAPYPGAPPTSYIPTTATTHDPRAADIITGGPLIQPPPLSAASTSLAGIVGKQPGEQLTAAYATATAGQSTRVVMIGGPTATTTAQYGLIAAGPGAPVAGSQLTSSAGALRFAADQPLLGAQATTTTGLIKLALFDSAAAIVAAQAGLVGKQGAEALTSSSVTALARAPAVSYGPSLIAPFAQALTGFTIPSIAVMPGAPLGNPFTIDFTNDFGPGPQAGGQGIIPAAIAAAGNVTGVTGQTVALVGALAHAFAGALAVQTQFIKPAAQVVTHAGSIMGVPRPAIVVDALTASANVGVTTLGVALTGAEANAIAGAQALSTTFGVSGPQVAALAGALGISLDRPSAAAQAQSLSGVITLLETTQATAGAVSALAGSVGIGLGPLPAGAAALALPGQLFILSGSAISALVQAFAGPAQGAIFRAVGGIQAQALASLGAARVSPQTSAYVSSQSGLLVPALSVRLSAQALAQAGGVQRSTVEALQGTWVQTASGLIVPLVIEQLTHTHGKAVAGDLQLGVLASPDHGAQVISQAQVVANAQAAAITTAQIRAEAGLVIAGSGLAVRAPSASAITAANYALPVLQQQAAAQAFAEAGSLQFTFSFVLTGAAATTFAGNLSAIPIYAIASEVAVAFDADDRLLYIEPDDRLVFYPN